MIRKTLAILVLAAATASASDSLQSQIDAAKAGDTVRIEESRPLSRDKRWSLLEVVERGQ